MIRTTNIRNGFIDTQNVRYVDEATFQRWTRRGAPCPGDVVLTREAPLGEVGIVRTNEPIFLGQRTIMYRADRRRLNPYFLMYAMLGPLVQGQIRGYGSGATVEHMRLPDCFNLRLLLPPLPIQHKVADVLSAYDHLIENNNRRIKILEEMAERIYREWFVEFRYPGHEEVPLADSELGAIPRGWVVSKVGEVASIIRGRSYRGVDIVDAGGVAFVNLKCIVREGGFRLSGIKRYAGNFKETHTVVSGDIVVAVTDMTQERRIVARAARVPRLGEKFGVMSMDVVKVAPRPAVSSQYLLGVLRYSGFPDQVKAFANGANVLHLHPERIADFRFPKAPDALAASYSEIVGAMYETADTLADMTDRLRAARELLLPRLISGEIDVDNLDIATEELAA